MGEKNTQDPNGNSLEFHARLFKECQALLSFAIKEGKPLKNPQLKLIDGSFESFSGTTDQLLSVYNYLIKVVKPATPRMILHLEQTEQRPIFIRVLGPIPIVRQFTVLALMSLLAFMVTSLSPDINVNTIQLSILQGSGMPQVKRLVFLIACASVGASFYGLFKMNYLLNKQNFDLSLTHTYWSRYILGIVAGLLLSELFIGMIEPTDGQVGHESPVGSIGFLLKPILAILGGFSADLVYTILSRLVETVENLFKGDSSDAAEQNGAKLDVQTQQHAMKVRDTTTQNLLALKQQLIKHDMPKEALNHLDGTINKVISDEED